MPLSSYKFHKHVIEHEFCPTCGVQCFAYGTDPSSGASMVAVNTRCLQDIDLAAVPRVAIHGKDF